MPIYPWPGTQSGNQTQTFESALPLLSIGSTDVVVTWPLEWANATYVVSSEVEGGVLLVGRVLSDLKNGTRSTTGCTITLTNTGIVSIAAGGRLLVEGSGQLL